MVQRLRLSIDGKTYGAGMGILGKAYLGRWIDMAQVTIRRKSEFSRMQG